MRMEVAAIMHRDRRGRRLLAQCHFAVVVFEVATGLTIERCSRGSSNKELMEQTFKRPKVLQAGKVEAAECRVDAVMRVGGEMVQRSHARSQGAVRWTRMMRGSM